MDSFNKKMKEAFSDFSGDIPEGMSWDEMQSGINDKMGKPNKRKGIIYFFLGVLISSVVGITWYANESDQKQNSTSIVTEEVPLQEISNDEITLVQVEQEKTDITESKYSKVKKEITKTNQTKTNELNSTTFSNRLLINEINHSSESAYFKEDGAVIDKEKNADINNEVNNSLPLFENQTSLSNSSLSSNIDKQSSLFERGLFDSETLKGVGLSSFNYQKNTLKFDINQPLISTSNQSESNFLNSYYLSVQSSIFSWSWNSAGEDGISIDNFEREQLSYGASILIGNQITDRWSFETGLRFRSFESEFNGKFYTEEQTFLDSIEQGYHNVITDEVYFEGRARAQVKTERTVRHFNSIRQFSIPVIVNYNMPFKKFEIGLGVGTEVGISHIAVGRSINKELQFVDYKSNSTLNKNVQVAFLSKINMSYPIAREMDLFIDGHIVRSMLSWSNANEDIRTPIYYGFSLGLKKQL